MNAVAWRFLEPLDVLFLRGNKLFGDPGSFGESLVPPWPSVAAGALRSRMLADDGTDLAAFASGRVAHPVLGTPDEPGPFAVTAFHLARRRGADAEALHPMPADLFLSRSDRGERSLRPLRPHVPARGLDSSAVLPQLPVLASGTRDKPIRGSWLTAAAWRKYVAGETPAAAELLESAALWSLDPRVGVGLDPTTGRAAEGRLFSVQAVAMSQEVGFLVGVVGAEDVPSGGAVRLGGDGRAAAVHAVAADVPEPDYDAIARGRRCRLVLTSPGLFPGGWLPTGCVRTETGEVRFALGDVRARLVCAAVPRAEVVSGWDLARWRPKPARRAAPAGSVYWLDELEATADALRKLAETGLWGEPCEDPVRRAEGFNRAVLAAWS